MQSCTHIKDITASEISCISGGTTGVCICYDQGGGALQQPALHTADSCAIVCCGSQEVASWGLYTDDGWFRKHAGAVITTGKCGEGSCWDLICSTGCGIMLAGLAITVANFLKKQ